MRTVTGVVFVLVTAAPALGGPIDQACIRSNKAANPVLCACIQRVANITLTGSDQRLAAKFFADPGKAQEVRQSGRSTHQAFWGRYVNFGETAEAVCSNG
jgi:hypothetical protein